MVLSKAVLFGFLTSVVLIPGVSAYKTSLSDEFIGEDSVFLYAALYKYAENEDTLGDDHEDPHIKVGMSQADGVLEFAKVDAVDASFFEITFHCSIQGSCRVVGHVRPLSLRTNAGH